MPSAFRALPCPLGASVSLRAASLFIFPSSGGRPGAAALPLRGKCAAVPRAPVPPAGLLSAGGQFNASIIFVLAFSVGRFAALVFPRSPVGAAQAVLNAMGAMLPPIPPSISSLLSYISLKILNVSSTFLRRL